MQLDGFGSEIRWVQFSTKCSCSIETTVGEALITSKLLGGQDEFNNA